MNHSTRVLQDKNVVFEDSAVTDELISSICSRIYKILNYKIIIHLSCEEDIVFQLSYE